MNKVVHKYADIALRPVDRKMLSVFYGGCRIYCRKKPLSRSLLIAGRAVKLPRAVKALYFSKLQLIG